MISGSGAVAQIGSGTTILTADNPYTGGTNVSAGTLVVGDFAHPSAALSGGGPITVASGGTLGGYGSVTGAVVNSGVIAAGSATPGLTARRPGLSPSLAICSIKASSKLGSGAEHRQCAGGSRQLCRRRRHDGHQHIPGRRRLALRQIGHQRRPAATGNTSVHVTNVGGPGAETTGNGILVVNAINGATTAPGAFTLSNANCAPAPSTIDLFRGGVSGSPNDWFLRSDFIVPPIPPGRLQPPDALPPFPPDAAAEPAAARRLSDHRAGTRHLWRGAASGAAIGALDPRHARRPGRRHLRAGWLRRSRLRPPPDALPTRKPGPTGLAPCPLFSPSVWGRFFGQTIDNHYQAFADPRASGNLGGFQGGIDLLRGSLIAGHYERAGLYGAYGDVNADVNGLVTNPAATAYILTRTGSMNLDAWSAGGYWTHVGPGGWYLDAVLQGTWYGGSASTQFARLDTDGTGFIASLEGGYPFAWPQFGPGFVLEPQGQILWQKVSFRHDYDGLGDVALGDTTGPSGRIGLRTKWTIVTAGGQVWQPYLRANLWRDWGAEANTVYSGTDIVPLASQVTMLELGGGLTGRINANVSVFANVDYEFAVGAGENEKRNGVRGAFGARYTW